jgi:uncharacterized protein YjaG (DUF416 family)
VRLPAQGLLAEFVVGAFDLERAGGYRMTAAELNEIVHAKFDGQTPTAWIDVTEAQLSTIRRLTAELGGRWRALAPGDSLELTFPAAL